MAGQPVISIQPNMKSLLSIDTMKQSNEDTEDDFKVTLEDAGNVRKRRLIASKTIHD